MLAPRPSLLSKRISPRICMRCQQRLQSTTTPSHEPTAESAAVPPAHPIPSRQQYKPAIPSYPTTAPNKTAPPSSQNARHADKSFHPALTGFIAGAMLSLGGAILAYYLSGSARLVKASHERHAHLTTRRKELFHAGSDAAERRGVVLGGREGNGEDTGLDEAEMWFGDTAFFYAAYVPGADAYLARNVANMRKARATPQGAVAVHEIIKNCAYELERLIGGGELGLMVGKQAWAIVHTHLEMVVDVAEEGRDVPEEIRKKVEKQLEGLKKVGSRAGRQERRLLEEKAMNGHEAKR